MSNPSSSQKLGEWYGKTISAGIVDEYATAAERFRQESEPACVLFADLVGSTEYKQRWGDLRGLVKTAAHNRVVTEAVRQAGGLIVKYLGDGVMAVFREDNAERRAIQSALGC
jgi:class 3 adenylate cyclase